mgnify:CR=1 FL=1
MCIQMERKLEMTRRGQEIKEHLENSINLIDFGVDDE